MRHVLLAAALLAAVAGCSSGGDPKPTDQQIGARVLQQFDTTNGHSGHAEADYRAQLDALTAKCTNPVKDVARFVENSYNDLAGHGVSDETALTVLQHLEASIPAGSRVDCQGTLAAYLVLRESGQN